MKENSLDFDDLLLKAAKLLKENPEILKIYQEKWEYIHIDEYQDTNEVQYLMSKMLSANNQNIPPFLAIQRLVLLLRICSELLQLTFAFMDNIMASSQPR